MENTKHSIKSISEANTIILEKLEKNRTIQMIKTVAGGGFGAHGILQILTSNMNLTGNLIFGASAIVGCMLAGNGLAKLCSISEQIGAIEASEIEELKAKTR